MILGVILYCLLRERDRIEELVEERKDVQKRMKVKVNNITETELDYSDCYTVDGHHKIPLIDANVANSMIKG